MALCKNPLDELVVITVWDACTDTDIHRVTTRREATFWRWGGTVRSAQEFLKDIVASGHAFEVRPIMTPGRS